MDNLKGTIDAFADALRRAEAHHKVHVGTWGDTDWVPFYAEYLANEFAGIRVPLPLPVIANVKGVMTLDASNRKWEPEASTETRGHDQCEYC